MRAAPALNYQRTYFNLTLYFRLFLTTIDQEFECDTFFPNLKIFGLACIPTFDTIKTTTDFKLRDTSDPSVDTDTTQEENGISWRYRVMEFVK